VAKRERRAAKFPRRESLEIVGAFAALVLASVPVWHALVTAPLADVPADRIDTLAAWAAARTAPCHQGPEHYELVVAAGPGFGFSAAEAARLCEAAAAVALPLSPGCPARRISCSAKAPLGAEGPPPDMFVRAKLAAGHGVDESQAWLESQLLPEAGAEGALRVALLRPPFGNLHPVVVVGRWRTAFVTLSTEIADAQVPHDAHHSYSVYRRVAVLKPPDVADAQMQIAPLLQKLAAFLGAGAARTAAGLRARDAQGGVPPSRRYHLLATLALEAEEAAEGDDALARGLRAVGRPVTGWAARAALGGEGEGPTLAGFAASLAAIGVALTNQSAVLRDVELARPQVR
jgi:hypothetical protein